MNCRLCNSNRLRLLYTQGDHEQFRFYRCRNCGLVNYDLAEGLDQEKYAQELVDPAEPSHPVNRAQTLTFHFMARHHPIPGRLLEIGCGNGRLLMLARDHGWQVSGIELSPFLAKAVERRLRVPIRVTDFLQLQPSREEKYDVVVLRHVLEHLPDGRTALSILHRLTAAEGHVLLEFPNIDALDLRFKRLLRRLGIHRKKYHPDYRPGHCNEYNRRAFEYLLRDTGFELVIWQTYSYNAIQNWFFNRWTIGNKARAWIRPRKDWSR